jgi:hypothetical protein
MKRSTAVPAALLGLVLLAPFAPTPADAATFTGQQGSYHPVTVSRILDTRKALGAPDQPIAAKGTLTLQVAGRGGVPGSGAAAVVINVTAVNATASAPFLTIYPSGSSRPTASTINFSKGRTTANTTTVPVGSDGKIKIFNSAGTTDVLVDVAGWYANGAAGATLAGGTDYLSQNPLRTTDTRRDGNGPLPSLYSLSTGITFGSRADNEDVRALAVNLTAIDAKRGGFLTAWDGLGQVPSTSALSFETKTPVANTAVVRSRPCTECTGASSYAPTIEVFNGSQGSVEVVVDVVGAYVDTATQDGGALRFVPVTPKRIIDSRTTNKPLTAKQTQVVKAGTTATAETATLVTNTTAITPSATTFFTLWAAGERPTASNLNAPAKRTVANGAYADLTTDNAFLIFNAAGTTNFAIDVTGKFDFAPYSAQAAVRRAAHQQQVGRQAAVAVVPDARHAAR